MMFDLSPFEEIALKSVVLLAVISLIAFTLRKATPATRHCVWAIGFLGLAVLPLMREWMPAHEIYPPVNEAPIVVSPPVVEPTRTIDPPKTIELPPSAKANAANRTIHVPNLQLEIPWRELFPVVWLIGGLLLLGRTVGRLLGTRGLVRRATPVEDVALQSAVAEASRQVGLRRTPDLLILGDADVPMTLGLLRPAILLPSTATDWQSQTAQAVLLHECAHIRRHDWALLVLAKLLCSIYWFNPIAWWADGRMRAASEEATDDMVLLAGVNAPQYAEELLNLASHLQRQRTTAHALAVVEPGTLKGRIQAILRQARRGGLIPRRVGLSALTISLAIVSLLACARLVKSLPPVYSNDGRQSLGNGHWVSIEAITDMSRQPRTWNMKGELLPEPLPVNEKFLDSRITDHPVKEGPIDRYVMVGSDIRDSLGICLALTAINRSQEPQQYRYSQGDSYRSLKGGFFAVGKVGFPAKGTGTLHVWAPSSEWKTYAEAKVANQRVISTTDKAFTPRIGTDSSGLGHATIDFELPSSFADKQAELVVTTPSPSTTVGHLIPMFQTGQYRIERSEGTADEITKIKLQVRPIKHVVFRNIPLVPKPNALVSIQGAGLPKMRQYTGNWAKFSDGSTIEIVGLIDENDQKAGGWTYDGRRTPELADPKSFHLDPHTVFGTSTPLGPDYRRLDIAFRRRSPKSSFGQISLYDHTGREIPGSSSSFGLGEKGGKFELRPLVVGLNVYETGLVVRCAIGEYKTVGKGVFGRDKGYTAKWVEKDPSSMGNSLKVTFPPEAMKWTDAKDFTFGLSDKQGKPIQLTNYSGSPNGGDMSFQMTKEQADKVGSIEFKQRGYEYVQFLKVALQPDGGRHAWRLVSATPLWPPATSLKDEIDFTRPPKELGFRYKNSQRSGLGGNGTSLGGMATSFGENWQGYDYRFVGVQKDGTEIDLPDRATNEKGQLRKVKEIRLYERRR